MPENFLAISALQHYAYCPRQFALIHVEQVWEENRFTAEGRILHERVDSHEAEQRKDIRYERSVLVKSEQYRIQGKMDLLEIHGTEDKRYFPVEYKRGKPKIEDWDRLQLCAQALCIEEMRETQVEEGAIWYWEARKREVVTIDEALRQETIEAISHASDIRERGITPPPTSHKKRCQGCSLYHLCEPNTFSKDWSSNYIASIGE
jgi:CRISPR-associated exonuclease Cas4